jgi:hypothetical protein
MSRLSYIIFSIVIALWYGHANAKTREENRHKCNISASYVDIILKNRPRDKTYIFSDAGSFWLTDFENKNWFSPKTGVAGRLPPVELTSRVKMEFRESSISACSELRQRLKYRNLKFGKYDVKLAEMAQARGISKFVILDIGLPIVSKDGKSAIIVNSQHSGFLAGGTYLYYLRKYCGNWIVVSVNRVYVA